MLCQVHHTSQPTQSDLWQCIHAGECQVWMLFKSLIPKERVRFFFEHRETHDFLEWQADQASQGEQAALTKISEAEYRTRLLLEEQKKPLSEARSEMNLQESRVESADRVLRESRPQVRSDIVTAPQPFCLSGSHGPGSFDDKIGIRDVDFILSQALGVNMCEVPSFDRSRASTTTLGS